MFPLSPNCNRSRRIAGHQSIKRFTWFGEDVPDKTWVPVVELVGKPPVEIIRIEDWFSRHPA